MFQLFVDTRQLRCCIDAFSCTYDAPCKLELTIDMNDIKGDSGLFEGFCYLWEPALNTNSIDGTNGNCWSGHFHRTLVRGFALILWTFKSCLQEYTSMSHLEKVSIVYPQLQWEVLFEVRTKGLHGIFKSGASQRINYSCNCCWLWGEEENFWVWSAATFILQVVDASSHHF